WSPMFFPTQVQPLVFPKLEMTTNVLATNSRRRLRSRVRNSGDVLRINSMGRYRHGNGALTSRTEEIHETPHSNTMSGCALLHLGLCRHVSGWSNPDIQEVAGCCTASEPW